MAWDATQLNLTGTKLQTLAYAVLAEAAETEAAQKNASDDNLKKTLSARADHLNIFGNELVLLSDIILGAAAYAEINENPDVPLNDASRLNLIDVWVSIFSDIIALAAAIEAAEN